jgi:RHS repeat-associated protein
LAADYDEVMSGPTLYMQQRYYEPLAGRFLSVDPVTTDGGTGGSFNRYAYANNNPYRFKDPDGRKVVGVYSNDGGTLFMVDESTRAWNLVQAESGGKPFGDAIPSGTYSILERAGREGFYRLESRDSKFGDDSTSDGRTNLRLHGPGRTIGCISVCTNDGFGKIKDMLNSTSTGKESVDDKSFLGQLLGRKESLTSYGSMQVLSSGQTLKFDAKSGNVSVETMRTGSRIPDRQVLCTVQKDGGCK